MPLLLTAVVVLAASPFQQDTTISIAAAIPLFWSTRDRATRLGRGYRL
jgi:hypothetical protein